MCVTVWAESASQPANSYHEVSNAQVEHITELLTHDFHAKRVEIWLLMLVHVRSGSPVFVHCVHRRGVEFTNASAELANPQSRVRQMADALELLTPENGGLSVGLRRVDHHYHIAAPDGKVGVVQDAYVAAGAERSKDTPYSSVCCGPLPPSDKPHLVCVGITIAGPAFDRLIAVCRNGAVIYLYGIEGPDLVSQDIRELDIRFAPRPLVETYIKPYEQGIHRLRLPVRSYDIITWDAAEEPCDVTYFDRFAAGTTQCVQDRKVSVRTGPFLVNAWHSAGADFLIHRMAIRGEA